MTGTAQPMPSLPKRVEAKTGRALAPLEKCSVPIYRGGFSTAPRF